MKIELNLNEVSSSVINALVNDKIIALGALTLEQKISYFCPAFGVIGNIINCEDLSKNDKIAMINEIITSERCSYRDVYDYDFIVQNCTDEAIQKFKEYFVQRYSDMSLLDKNTYIHVFDMIEKMGLEFDSYQKKAIKKEFWNYVERCNTYATATHIYPENTPEWCVNLYFGDYDSIHRRIALHKATGWKHYNPNKPDNRVQVRAAYAAVHGTNKEQAIHDNAYSLRLKAVKEHNVKL